MQVLWSWSAHAINLLALVSFAGCAHGGRVSFRSTDLTFHPRSRTSEPEVYRHRESLPHVMLHSVGIIEVSGSDASARAAAKGQELGCWALVEHSIFETIDQPAWAEDRPFDGSAEASALFGHGSLHTVTSVSAPPAVQFDCVLLATAGDHAK